LGAHAKAGWHEAAHLVPARPIRASEDFSQTTDEEVVALLDRYALRTGTRRRSGAANL
jgi:hypothetical protein